MLLYETKQVVTNAAACFKFKLRKPSIGKFKSWNVFLKNDTFSIKNITPYSKILHLQKIDLLL